MDHKIAASCIILLLTTSFLVALAPSNVKASEPTLIDNINSLVNNVINWNFTDDGSVGWNSIMTQTAGMQFGKTNYTQLASDIDSLTNPLEVLEAYSELGKLSEIPLNQTKIEWALDNIVMMPNGLPKNSINPGEDSFSTYYRFALQGFYYAQKYNYDLAKWNVTNAYDNFHNIVFKGTSCQCVLWVYGDNTTYMESYGPRYYDEGAETLDCFLIFYQMGIASALDDANNICNWIYDNLWNGNNFDYALNWKGYECEAPAFVQIILKLEHYDNATDKIGNLTTDLMNRYLIQQWNSPQWTYKGTSYYAAVHMHDSNSQVRLQNTLGAWSVLNGIYFRLPADQKVNMRLMIQGKDTPAWKLLYDNSTLWTGSAFINEDATGTNAQAAILLILLGIVPGSGSIAIPVSEQYYEDTSNVADPELYALDLTSNVLTVPIMNPGTLTFIYGETPVTFNFQTSGVYNVTFSKDYNSIINANLISTLPSNRLYINLTSDIPSPPPPQQTYPIPFLPLTSEQILIIATIIASVTSLAVVLLWRRREDHPKEVNEIDTGLS